MIERQARPVGFLANGQNTRVIFGLILDRYDELVTGTTEDK
jgi:hypothetical protein